MNPNSHRSRRRLHALLAGSFAWLLWPSAGTFAQEDVAPATAASSAAPAEAPAQSRRDRRRAAKADSAPSEAQTAVAAPPAQPAGDVQAPEAIVESEIVCKNIKPLGTRMARRICGTAAQWAALEKKTTDAAEDDMRQVGGQGAILSTTPGAAVGPP